MQIAAFGGKHPDRGYRCSGERRYLGLISKKEAPEGASQGDLAAAAAVVVIVAAATAVVAAAAAVAAAEEDDYEDEDDPDAAVVIVAEHIITFPRARKNSVVCVRRGGLMTR